MTIQANLGWRFAQQACVIAGVIGMTRLAIPILDRFMCRYARNIFMTGQTEPSFKSLKLDSRALNLVTIVAVTAADRWVDYDP
jgi:hypothetical protein